VRRSFFFLLLVFGLAGLSVGPLLNLAEGGLYAAIHFGFECFSFLFLAELVVGLTIGLIALLLLGEFPKPPGFGFAGLPG
jgi:hypothetical protein